MTTNVELILQPGVYETLVKHLLPPRATCEEAAFGFASTQTEGGRLTFDLLELFPVPPEGFIERLRYFLHLTDETRARHQTGPRPESFVNRVPLSSPSAARRILGQRCLWLSRICAAR